MNLAKVITPTKVGASVRRLLDFDLKQYWIVVAFAIQAGTLSLAIPLAVQWFVNSITFIGTLQPIYLLSIVLLAVLGFSAALQVLQFMTVEKLEQRFFARNYVSFIEALPELQPRPDTSRNQQSLRFWELVSAQKNAKTVFIELLAVFLQILSGFLLISFYHPWLLLYATILTALVVIYIRSTRTESLQGRYDLSHAKYSLAEHAQDVAQNFRLFLGKPGQSFLNKKTDHLLDHYLGLRQSYFKSVLSQNIGLTLIYVLGTSLLLALGGVLVLKEQLALGQLVASEIIVSASLYQLWKLGQKVESIDSYFIAAYKFSETLPTQNESATSPSSPVELTDFSVSGHQLIAHPEQKIGLPNEFKWNPGHIVLLSGSAGQGKSWAAKLISGERSPYRGHVALGDVDIREIPSKQFQSYVFRAQRIELLAGSVFENLQCFAPDLTIPHARRILEALQMGDVVSSLENGIHTHLNFDQMLLSKRQLALLMVARLAVSSFKVMVIDELLDALDEISLNLAINALSTPDRVLVITTSHPQRYLQLGISNILKIDLGAGGQS
jgi:putative ABC transport system ATP-binding protein